MGFFFLLFLEIVHGRNFVTSKESVPERYQLVYVMIIIIISVIIIITIVIVSIVINITNYYLVLPLSLFHCHHSVLSNVTLVSGLWGHLSVSEARVEAGLEYSEHHILHFIWHWDVDEMGGLWFHQVFHQVLDCPWLLHCGGKSLANLIVTSLDQQTLENIKWPIQSEKVLFDSDAWRSKCTKD